MKLARRRPRNPFALAPLLKKGGAHRRQDAKAPRAKHAREMRRRLREDL